MSKNATCRQCHAPLHGRIDKKFCDDGCRNLYHNQRNRMQNQTIRRINSILAKNYRMLKAMQNGPNSKWSYQDLLRQGFNFYYYTSTQALSKGITSYWLYDIGYYFHKNGHLALIRNIHHYDNIARATTDSTQVVNIQRPGNVAHRGRTDY